MLLIVVGVVVGLLLAFVGRVDAAAGHVDAAADAVVVKGVHRVIATVAPAAAHGKVAPAVVALVAVAVPALLSWVLVALAGTPSVIRGLLGVLLVIVIAGSFVLLPITSALVLSAALVLVAVLVRIATKLVLTLPLVAAAVALGVRQVVLVVGDHASGLGRATRDLQSLSLLGHGLWHVVAVVVALAPLLGTALSILRLPRRS